MRNTAIIILNWNGGLDTINCIHSLLPNLNHQEDSVFIVDNNSSDNSVQLITEDLENNSLDFILTETKNITKDYQKCCHFYILKNEKNLGFGTGNNSLLKQFDAIENNFDLIWLLNNDTIIDGNTLISLKNKISENKEIGAVGSIVLNYPDNGRVQNTGVKYFPYLGVSKFINKNKKISEISFSKSISFDYLNGASLMLNFEAVKKVGFFDERYFLYSEEFDLQLAMKSLGYSILLEPKSHVYHHLMGSTKGNSHLFYYYYSNSSTLLTKKHFNFLVLSIATLNLTFITFVRTFPSLKNFTWGMKGIIKGLRFRQ